MRLVGLKVTLLWLCALGAVAITGHASAEGEADLHGVSATQANNDAHDPTGESAEPVKDGGHTYSYGCDGETVAVGCGQPCPGPPPGTWIDVFRDGELLDTVCAADTTQPTVTPGMVQFEFEALTWPSAELTVQPPNGEAFVNIETLFYTELAEAQRKTVTLLGHDITIVADPVEYIWHSGEAESEPWSTTDPSHRLRDDEQPEDMNHYVYADADVTVNASVDVVYQGKFQVDGGEWQDIPATLTVTGDPESLEIREAHGLLESY